MVKQIIILLTLYCLINCCSYSQSENKEPKVFSELFFEYNTTLVLSHNAKLYTDLDILTNKYIEIAIQPGAEFIYGFEGVENPGYVGSPYYDMNLLCSIHLLPNKDISLKPFIGTFYRLTSCENRKYFDIKYGSTFQLKISKLVTMEIKVMNTNTRGESIFPVLMGIGCIIRLF